MYNLMYSTALHDALQDLGAGCCSTVLQGLLSCTAKLLLGCTAELQRTAALQAAVLHRDEAGWAVKCTSTTSPLLTTFERRIADCNTVVTVHGDCVGSFWYRLDRRCAGVVFG